MKFDYLKIFSTVIYIIYRILIAIAVIAVDMFCVMVSQKYLKMSYNAVQGEMIVLIIFSLIIIFKPHHHHVKTNKQKKSH